MRSILSAIFIAVAVLADDKSFCEKKCAEKYPEQEELKHLSQWKVEHPVYDGLIQAISWQIACNDGCAGRASITEGPFSFVDCHKKCDSKYGEGNETKGESGARVACAYACSLPMSRSVFMSVNYANGEKPVVKIIRKEGDEVSTSIEDAPLTGSIDVDRFVTNVLGDLNRHILSFRNPFNPNPAEDFIPSPDMMMGPGPHMMAMHERMNAMMDAFSRQFFDGIRRQMHREHHSAMNRPSGHDGYAHKGPEIGNMLSNGEPIIITHPVSAVDEDDARARPIKVVRYQMTSNHPPSVFYWIMIVFGIGALLLTLYASVIFFRVMRSAAYRRISADAPGRRPAAPPAPGALPVKKVPIDGWVEHSEPAGVPPPAYDQVSIHSIHKEKVPDPAEQPLSEAETTSPAPNNEQK